MEVTPTHKRVERYETGLPIGVDAASGELVEFEEARIDPSRLLPSAGLTDEQRSALAMARVERALKWPARDVLPGGFVDRARALEEMDSGSELGKLLVDTEAQVARWVVEELRKEHALG